MSVRITARCSKCAHKFTPRRDPDGYLAMEDEAGALVCDDCVCSYCNNGHGSQAQYDECAHSRWDDAREALCEGDSEGDLNDDIAIDVVV